MDTDILQDSPALHALKRPQLLSLCKRYGVKAVGKNTELITRLQEFGREQKLLSPSHNDSCDLSMGSAWELMDTDEVPNERKEDQNAQNVAMDVVIEEEDDEAERVGREFGICATDESQKSNSQSSRASNRSFKEKLNTAFRSLGGPKASSSANMITDHPDDPSSQHQPNANPAMDDIPFDPLLLESLNAPVQLISPAPDMLPPVPSELPIPDPYQSPTEGGIIKRSSSMEIRARLAAMAEGDNVPVPEIPKEYRSQTEKIDPKAKEIVAPLNRNLSPPPPPAFVFGTPSSAKARRQSVVQFEDAAKTVLEEMEKRVLANRAAAGVEAGEKGVKIATFQDLFANDGGDGGDGEGKEGKRDGIKEATRFDVKHQKEFEKMESIASSRTNLKRKSSAQSLSGPDNALPSYARPLSRTSSTLSKTSTSSTTSNSLKSNNNAAKRIKLIEPTEMDRKLVDSLLAEGWSGSGSDGPVGRNATNRFAKTPGVGGVKSGRKISVIREEDGESDRVKDERKRLAMRQLELQRARRRSNRMSVAGSAARRKSLGGKQVPPAVVPAKGGLASRFFKSAVNSIKNFAGGAGGPSKTQAQKPKPSQPVFSVNDSSKPRTGPTTLSTAAATRPISAMSTASKGSANSRPGSVAGRASVDVSGRTSSLGRKVQAGGALSESVKGSTSSSLKNSTSTSASTSGQGPAWKKFDLKESLKNKPVGYIPRTGPLPSLDEKVTNMRRTVSTPGPSKVAFGSVVPSTAGRNGTVGQSSSLNSRKSVVRSLSSMDVGPTTSTSTSTAVSGYRVSTAPLNIRKSVRMSTSTDDLNTMAETPPAGGRVEEKMDVDGTQEGVETLPPAVQEEKEDQDDVVMHVEEDKSARQSAVVGSEDERMGVEEGKDGSESVQISGAQSHPDSDVVMDSPAPAPAPAPAPVNPNRAPIAAARSSTASSRPSLAGPRARPLAGGRTSISTSLTPSKKVQPRRKTLATRDMNAVPTSGSGRLLNAGLTPKKLAGSNGTRRSAAVPKSASATSTVAPPNPQRATRSVAGRRETAAKAGGATAASRAARRSVAPQNLPPVPAASTSTRPVRAGPTTRRVTRSTALA